MGLQQENEEKQAQPQERYSRQIALPEIGENGQRRLGNANILLVGIGGLGSAAALYLAGAGVGTLGILDADVVDISNLQRQIIYSTSDVGRSKTSAAMNRLSAFNPSVRVNAHPHHLTPPTATELLEPYDFVIDATDNFEAKFLIADACHAAHKPYSHAGISGFFGQTITVLPGQTSCYRCIFETVPASNQSPDTVRGPLGVLPGVLGTIQATEAIKFVLGCGDLLTNRLLTYDALSMTFRIVKVTPNQHCTLCGNDTKGRTT
jgi:molybdopterin/thiamine biosynthesis adenylyltransferase